MMLRNVFVAAAAAFSALPAQAQPVVWSSPVLDHYFDASSASIRIVSGVAGAASVDGVVPSAVKLHRAFVAPGKRFAILQTADGSPVLLDWTGESTVRELPGVAASLDSVAFSRSGNAAALVSAGKVQVFRGLPEDPAIQQEIAIDSTALAVAEDGTVAAVADGIYLFESGEARLLAAGDYAAVAFRPGTREIAAAGRFSDTVVGVRAGAGLSTLASAEDGIAEPVALEFSNDGSKLVVANRRGRSATVVDMHSEKATSVACDCNASAASPAASDNVFRIAGSGDSLVFLDASSGGLRTFTVPVIGETR
jgi:hypothetical protein